MAPGFWRGLRPRTRNILLVGGGLALLVIALAAFALWELGRSDIFNSGQDDLGRAELERLTGITIPAGASGLRSHVESWQDTIVHLRFELPAAALPAWVAGQAWDTPPAAGPLAYPFAQAPEWMQRAGGWWRPQEAGSFQVGALGGPAGIYQHVLIDTSDPATAVVYVVSFDT
ncbi:MAG TPA: hypothetical protein VD886_06895 [Herpetosiphonaceae bacterium]|nr:hypothetical protein [Herpetosiphonaceae bacterium]